MAFCKTIHQNSLKFIMAKACSKTCSKTWEKLASSDAKMERWLCLQESQGLSTSCSCNLCHARLGKLVTKKVIRDKNNAKHANVGFRKGCVIGESLIFKGADIHMHYSKKKNFDLSKTK